MKQLFAVLIFVLSIFPAVSQTVISSVTSNWVSLGPSNIPNANGRIDFLRFAPNDSNIIWAGSRTGGLWKSINAGTSWIPATDYEPFIGCYDVAISNSNSDIMYIAKGTRGLTGNAYDIGISKSIDGGISWSPSGLSFSSCCDFVYKLEINPDDNDIIFAATSDGIYMSQSGGMNWNRCIAGNFNEIKFKPGNSSVMYAVEKGISTTRFYRSQNAGFTFDRIYSGLPDSLSDAEGFNIGVTPANPDYVYLLACNANGSGFTGIYRSIDGGLNFTTQCSASTLIEIKNGVDNMCIDVNPANADDVYIGGYLPYHSSDGGVSWQGTSFANLSHNFHAMKFATGNSTTIFTGNDGGFYKTNRADSTWAYLSGGLQVGPNQGMGAVPGTNLILTGHHGNGALLYNSGSWSQVFEGDITECIIDPANQAVMYIASPYGNIYKSTNSGGSFLQIVFTDSTAIHSNGNFLAPFIMHPSDPNTLLLGKHEAYRSIDGGASWNALAGISDSLPLVALAFAKSDPDHIYAATKNTFYACSNGNMFSQRIASFPGEITGIAVSSSDPQKIWVTMSGFVSGNGVYFSDDAGLNWTDYSIGLPNLPVNCIVYQDSSNDALFVGLDVGVYYRSNSFSDWQYCSNNLPNVQVRELEIQYDLNRIRAATYGRGLWESDISLIDPVAEINKNQNLRIIPNPSSEKIRIRINEDIQFQKGVLRIFNSLGDVVFYKAISNKNDLMLLDIHSLANGIYTCSLLTDGKNYFSEKLSVIGQ